MSQAGAYIPAMGFTPNRFTLHNASPEPQTFRWGGVQFTIPGVDMVGKDPARDVDGDPIPGTLMLEDTYAPDRDGIIPPLGTPPNWSAFEAIKSILGVDPATKVAGGVAAKGGISFLPNSPSKDLVARIREDGKRRYAESRVEWAQYTVAAYEARVAAARAVGAQAAPPDEDYSKAVQVLKKWKEGLGKSEEVPLDDEEMEFMAFAKARALEMASAASEGKNVDKAALAEELLLDPKVRTYLSRKYQIRKRGYMDVPVPESPPEV